MNQDPHMSEFDNLNDLSAPNPSGEQFGLGDSSISEHAKVPSLSIVEELEIRLGVGQVMKSIEDTYLLYCKYAHTKGFGVNKGDQRYFMGTKEIQAKEFECSCQARLRVGREKGGEWKVTRFVLEHNHEMIAASQTHLLRSSRNISHAQKSTMEALVNAKIPLASMLSYMEDEAQGPEHLGFIRKDAYDHFYHIKKCTKIENGDASELLQHFVNKSNDKPLFYWNMQVDDDNRLMNFFFRDHQCRVDFEYFGDVFSVDTTYRTNIYDLICAPFVGINHHKQNVMFGLAFMSDKTESSFEWLFRTFLKSMGGKQPGTIFTDQCQAMMNAIDTVFPCAHHRLCQWHINQNAPSHLGSMNNNSGFKKLWNEFTHHCDYEEEFEVTWEKMINDYNLDGHNWLKGMYNLRRGWSTAFSNNKFSAGLLATSRSEGTNSVLKKAGNRTISLYSFVLNYEKVQKTWRANEKIEDTRCLHGKPVTILKNNPLLDHGANVYTLNIFNLFQVELFESLNIQLREQPSHSGHFSRVFEMQSYGQNSKVRIVVFDVQKKEIRCSCHKFESMGILCRHALRVFNCMNVHIIPEMSIKKRWTKEVVVKGTKRKGKNYQITTLECPSQESTNAPNTQEPVHVQPSHYPTVLPFQEKLVENQPYWSQMGGNVPSTFSFVGILLLGMEFAQ
ncbi:hypothetical protein BUALT_Bualt04G0107300 [Buddleja alternifolia]|uniref:SWIM-type domain-containing protein n=1 Tax=Buddleja alternifolia TaxID=168488 RepID=A0AAV6XPA9_9LAMI|nr:hypothetical protein BUALT_Bualt04G0107300 [Buddleja alternifolia]